MTTVWSRSSGKYKTLRTLKILYRVVYTVPYLYCKVATINPATLRRVRHEDIFSSLGRPQGGHVIITRSAYPVPLLYRTLGKFNNLLPTFSRCAAINYYTLYSAQKMGIYFCTTLLQKLEFAAVNFTVLNSMYQALTSA